MDVTRSDQLDAFFDGIDVAINTVGPFAELGMPVVEAAVANGVAYVDSTGEFGFMNDVYVRFSGTGPPVVPACGFDYIPGDLAAAVAAASLPRGERAEQVTVAYELLGMVPSRGTMRTGLGALNNLAGTRPTPRRARFSDGERTGLQISWGEDVTVPRHVPGAEVAVVVALPGVAVMAPLVPLLTQAARFALPLAGPLVDSMPEGPSESLRRRARFTVTAEARSASGASAAVMCKGSDPYGLTARFLVEAALRVRGGGEGAMAPAQALGDPAAFLDSVSGDDPDFSWRHV